MASISIRNLDDDLKHRLRVRAGEHGWLMEEEARESFALPSSRLRHRSTWRG